MSTTNKSRPGTKHPPTGAETARPSDAIPARHAAALTLLDLREQFYVTLWSLVQLFDPATGSTHQLPETYRFPMLTNAELRHLRRSDPAAAEAYLQRKTARDQWARATWLVVPPWGGRKGPRSEWWFSAERCRRWGEQLLGGDRV